MLGKAGIRKIDPTIWFLRNLPLPERSGMSESGLNFTILRSRIRDCFRLRSSVGQSMPPISSDTSFGINFEVKAQNPRESRT